MIKPNKERIIIINIEKSCKKNNQELEKQLQIFDENVIFSVTNTEGIITHVSKAFCELSGYTNTEVIGRPHTFIRYTKTPKQSYKNIWKTIINKKIWKNEIKYRRKDGSSYWVEVTIKPKFNDNKNIEAYYTFSQDITSKKELEKLLIKEKAKEIINSQEDSFYKVQFSEIAYWQFNGNSNDLFITDFFLKMLGYDKNEIVEEKYKNDRFMPIKGGLTFWETLIHPDDLKNILKSITEHLNGETRLYKVSYRIKKKDGSWIWGLSLGETVAYDEDGKPTQVNGVTIDIQDAKEIEQANNQHKLFLDAILDSQEQIVITTDGKILKSVNKKFLDFFDIQSIDEFLEYNNCICEKFKIDETNTYLQKDINGIQWIDYVILHHKKTHKVMITSKGKNRIFTVTAALVPIGDGEIKSAVFTDITPMEEIRKEIELLHKHTQESIEYASLIQHALIPSNEILKKYFSDYFTIWHPKDTVGGDIYLFNELRDDNECLLMVIDCTGHGVPGAFITMLVKSIESQIISNIINSNEIVSPSKILSIFNKRIKFLLNQEKDDSISNAGFDAAILYYNIKEQVVKYSGALIPLFYIKDDKLNIIKGNHQSIGYKRSESNYKFKEHTIKVKEGMQFYLTTDGYLDQNGGEKGFPFGKKRFSKILENNLNKIFADIEEILLYEMMEYQGKEEKNDDITMVGIKIGK